MLRRLNKWHYCVLTSKAKTPNFAPWRILTTPKMFHFNPSQYCCRYIQFPMACNPVVYIFHRRWC